MSSTIGLLFALIISALAIAAVAWPLLKKGPAPVMVEDDRLMELLQRKDQVLASIKELEFDYHVGKLSAEDYQLYDQRLRRQAIGLIQQIEKVAPESAGLDASLESKIQRQRKVADGTAKVAHAAPDAEIEAAIARRRQTAPVAPSVAPSVAAQANGGDVRFCTNCGNQIAPHHKFCANCGTPVAESASAAAIEPA
jgi:hypothetical protein